MNMNKKLAAVLVSACVMGMTACGGSTNVVKDTTAAAGTTAAAAASEESAASAGYGFEVRGVSVVPGMEMAPILEKLGKEDSYFEAQSCAYQGMDKTYTYGSVEINTYPKDDKDYVQSIILKDDSQATPEGIYIGDDKDKVIKAYGKGTESGNSIVYEKDKTQLTFIISDGKVSSIQYFAVISNN